MIQQIIMKTSSYNNTLQRAEPCQMSLHRQGCESTAAASERQRPMEPMPLQNIQYIHITAKHTNTHT